MSLRRLAMREGSFLVMRQVLGLAVSLVGSLVLMRLLGPAEYGKYAGAVSFFTILASVAGWGIPAYLIRHQEDDNQAVFDQGVTLMLLFSVVGVAVTFALSPWLDRWVRIEGFAAVNSAMALGLPVVLIWRALMAWLERDLVYKPIAAVELGTAVLSYAVSIGLALLHWGIWAPVIGWWCQQLATLALMVACTPYRPRPSWQRPLVGRIMDFGLGWSAANWTWQLKGLVNPLLVGRLLGAEAVGYVAIAIRLSETVGFLKGSAGRLGASLLARVQQDRAAVAATLRDGMCLQLLVLGPLLVGFVWAIPLVIGPAFGAAWLPALPLFPFVAFGVLANAAFTLHSVLLTTLGRNWRVVAFNALHVAVFAGAAAVGLKLGGLEGYGWAELAAAAAYALLHAFLRREDIALPMGVPMLWLGVLAISLFAPRLGWWTTGILTAIALPASRFEIRRMLTMLGIPGYAKVAPSLESLAVAHQENVSR